jgi:thiamine biosynthesis lipoprotein ApbE
MKAFHLPVLLSCLAVLAGCQPSPREAELAGSVQGTTYRIKVVVDGLAIDLAQLSGGIEQTFAAIEMNAACVRLRGANRLRP